MKLLNKIFKKDNNQDENKSEEEYKTLDESGKKFEKSDINEITHSNNKSKIKDIISEMNLEDIYEIKELIDERLKNLHKEYGLTEADNVEIEDENMILDENFNEVKEDENDNFKEKLKDEKIQKDNNVEDEYVEFVNSKNDNDDKETTKIDNKIEEEEIVDKLKSYFGENNVFFEIRNDLQHETLKDKEVYCIGIRAREAFNDESFDLLKQNSWFIRNIKKLDELKNFKMINSSNVEKNLVLDKGEHAILICYKASNVLKSINEFNFN